MFANKSFGTSARNAAEGRKIREVFPDLMEDDCHQTSATGTGGISRRCQRIKQKVLIRSHGANSCAYPKLQRCRLVAWTIRLFASDGLLAQLAVRDETS